MAARLRRGLRQSRTCPHRPTCPDLLLIAFTEAGYGPRGDVNGATPFVADRYQTTFTARTRHTPADAYLSDEVRARPNLRVITQALVTRIVFDGSRATDVVYEHDGAEHTLSVQWKAPTAISSYQLKSGIES